MTDTGTFFSAARARAGMSQEHLAKAAGVSVRTIIRAESGQSLSHESRRALCAALDVTPPDMPEMPEMPPPAPAPDGQDAWHGTVEALLHPGDTPEVRDGLAKVAAGLAEAVPTPRLVARPDAAGMRRFFNEREGMPWLAPDRPGYYRRLCVQFGLLTAGVTFASCAGGGYLLDQPGIPAKLAGGLLGILALLFCWIHISFLHMADRRKSREAELDLTLYAIDESRLWEVIGQRVPRSDGFRIKWKAIPLVDVTDVSRLDSENGSVLIVRAGEERIAMEAIGVREANIASGILGYGAIPFTDRPRSGIPVRS